MLLEAVFQTFGFSKYKKDLKQLLFVAFLSFSKPDPDPCSASLHHSGGMRGWKLVSNLSLQQ